MEPKETGYINWQFICETTRLWLICHVDVIYRATWRSANQFALHSSTMWTDSFCLHTASPSHSTSITLTQPPSLTCKGDYSFAVSLFCLWNSSSLSVHFAFLRRDLQIVFLRSNRISNRIGRPIRFRIKFSNRIGRIYHASRNTV